MKNTVYYVVIISGDSAVQTNMRRAFGKMLPQAVIESLYGPEAIRFICHSSTIPDMILIDRNERMADGIDLVQLIRATDDLAAVPVVMLTEDSHTGSWESTGAFVQAVVRKSTFMQTGIQLLNNLRDLWYGIAPGKSVPGILQT